MFINPLKEKVSESMNRDPGFVLSSKKEIFL